MNWQQVEGQWAQVKGTIRTTWGKLTHDDVEALAGKKDQLMGKIQERYGVMKEDAEKQIDTWLATFKPAERKPEKDEPPVTPAT